MFTCSKAANTQKKDDRIVREKKITSESHRLHWVVNMIVFCYRCSIQMHRYPVYKLLHKLARKWMGFGWESLSLFICYSLSVYVLVVCPRFACDMCARCTRCMWFMFISGFPSIDCRLTGSIFFFLHHNPYKQNCYKTTLNGPDYIEISFILSCLLVHNLDLTTRVSNA